MRAVIARQAGPPEVLEVVELPDPRPDPGQVLIDVSVAATTFVDTQMRAGVGPRALAPDDFPVVLGNGVAGTVVGLGEGVDAGWLRTRVVTTTGGSGGYATRAAAQAADLHRIPPGVGDREALAVLADGRTALSLAGAAAIVPAEVVVITAAAGGVGSLLVQLATEAGARVVGLASSEAKRTFVRSLGADVVLDYTAADWASELDAAVGQLDVVFDGVGGSTTATLAARLGAGGRYLQHGAASGSVGIVDADALAERSARVITLMDLPGDPRSLHGFVEDAVQAVATGRLRPSIGLVVPFDDAAAAHRAMEARAVLGKTLLVPNARL